MSDNLLVGTHKYRTLSVRVAETVDSVIRKVLTPSRDFCPKSPDSKHSFDDYTYWGSNHPKCSYCGFEDKTRVLEGDK